MTDREYLAEAREWLEHIKNLTGWTAADSEKFLRRMKTLKWLIEQAEKAERYEKALREIANEQEVGEGDFNADDVANNLIATAKEALEGAE